MRRGVKARNNKRATASSVTLDKCTLCEKAGAGACVVDPSIMTNVDWIGRHLTCPDRGLKFWIRKGTFLVANG